MVYDNELGERIAELLDAQEDITEKMMFGGRAFFVNGNMTIAASGKGGLLVRSNPADVDKLLKKPGAQPSIMRGRVMTGWLDVDGDAAKTKAKLAFWVDQSSAFTRTLPPK